MLEHLDNMDDKMIGMKNIRSSHRYRSSGEKSVDRGNQQERLRKATWLAAMLECEGTFTFQYNEQIKNGRIHSHIQPRVIFVNSDLNMVNFVEKTMKCFEMETYRRDGIKSGMGRKAKSEVQVNGFKVLPLLYLLKPLMVGEKVEVVECLIRFIEYRKSLKNGKQKYGDFEFELLNKVRKINSGHWHRRSPRFISVSSTTVRQRRESAKIKSDLQRNLESVAEMPTPTGIIQ